jgi:hypothetical protein
VRSTVCVCVACAVRFRPIRREGCRWSAVCRSYVAHTCACCAHVAGRMLKCGALQSRYNVGARTQAHTRTHAHAHVHMRSLCWLKPFAGGDFYYILEASGAVGTHLGSHWDDLAVADHAGRQLSQEPLRVDLKRPPPRRFRESAFPTGYLLEVCRRPFAGRRFLRLEVPRRTSPRGKSLRARGAVR